MATATAEPTTIQPFGGQEKWTPSQHKAMAYTVAKAEAGERGFIYWLGGVRSGKSFGATLCLCESMRLRDTPGLYLVLGFTQSQLQAIYGRYFTVIGEAMGFEVKVTGGASPRVRLGSHEVLFKGAGVAGKDKAIQGLTLDGLIIDELPLLDRDTVHQAEARVSGRGGLRIYTSNKTSKYHWTCKYYLDRLRERLIQGIVLDSVVADNPHIDDDYVEERKDEYQGNTLTRFIENEFTLDKPPIYTVVQGLADGRVKQQVVSIFGHSHGFEYLVAERRADRLQVVRCQSLSRYGVDWGKMVAGLAPCTVLLNSGESVLARQLRGMNGVAVRGYREGAGSFVQFLQTACDRQSLWVDDVGAPGIMEAILTYHTPGQYTMPIMQAFDALALVLRHSTQ